MRIATTVALGIGLLAPAVYARQATVPAPFHGDWVPQKETCEAAPARLRVAAASLTLVNGKDTQTWANVAVPTSFFGPEYKGISVVAIPDWDGAQPFMVYFNNEEKKGVTIVDIYTPMPGTPNPQVAKIQAAAKALATRFPLNKIPLKQCR